MAASSLSYLTQTGEEKNFDDRIQSLVNSIKPVKTSGVMGFLITIATLDAITRIFRGVSATIGDMRWNKHPHQTVFKSVFDRLVFKNVPENPADIMPYSVIDRATLEEKTMLLDFSAFTKKQQQIILQRIIDTCVENPAVAKLF